MRLNERVDRTVREVQVLLGIALADEQRQRLRSVIERTLVSAVLEESQRCAGVVRECCPADDDRAHKAAQEIVEANSALMANLSSLR